MMRFRSLQIALKCCRIPSDGRIPAAPTAPAIPGVPGIPAVPADLPGGASRRYIPPPFEHTRCHAAAGIAFLHRMWYTDFS